MPPLNDGETQTSDIRSDIMSAFSSNDKAAETTAPVETTSAPASGAPAAAADAGKSPAVVAAEKALEPPARWTKEEKEEFLGFDPKIQKILLARNKGLESHWTKQNMAIANERSTFKAIEEILSPRRDAWKKAGLDDRAALNYVFSQWDLAEKDGPGFIQAFARSKGIDLRSMFGPTPDQLAASANPGTPGQTQNAQSQAMHPAVAQQLATLGQTVNSLQSSLRQREQHEQSAVTQAATNELRAFIDAKDDSDQPLYPFFEELKADMAALMQTGRAETLKDAYEMASRMNLGVFTRIQESNDLKRRREEDARRAAEAERARKAAAPVASSGASGAPSSSSDDDESMSIRALLERGFKSAKASSARI